MHAEIREKQESELGLVAMSFAGPNAGHVEGLSVVVSKNKLQVVRRSTDLFKFSLRVHIEYTRRVQIRINPIPSLVKNSR